MDMAATRRVKCNKCHYEFTNIYEYLFGFDAMLPYDIAV